ncbi:MAG: hypothetical protein HYV63_33910 [Candidatus Schekmanbacteria bacterium]|nr:hypothetical protein [Candidatus Schekmanbacteria bacterium]
MTTSTVLRFLGATLAMLAALASPTGSGAAARWLLPAAVSVAHESRTSERTPEGEARSYLTLRQSVLVSYRRAVSELIAAYEPHVEWVRETGRVLAARQQAGLRYGTDVGRAGFTVFGSVFSSRDAGRELGQPLLAVASSPFWQGRLAVGARHELTRRTDLAASLEASVSHGRLLLESADVPIDQGAGTGNLSLTWQLASSTSVGLGYTYLYAATRTDAAGAGAGLAETSEPVHQVEATCSLAPRPALAARIRSGVARYERTAEVEIVMGVEASVRLRGGRHVLSGAADRRVLALEGAGLSSGPDAGEGGAPDPYGGAVSGSATARIYSLAFAGRLGSRLRYQARLQRARAALSTGGELTTLSSRAHLNVRLRNNLDAFLDAQLLDQQLSTPELAALTARRFALGLRLNLTASDTASRAWDEEVDRLRTVLPYE